MKVPRQHRTALTFVDAGSRNDAADFIPVASLGNGRAVRVERPPAHTDEAAPWDEAAAAAAPPPPPPPATAPAPAVAQPDAVEVEEDTTEQAPADADDRPPFVPSRTDMLIREWYGDYLHADTGEYLRGGVPADIDLFWQDALKQLLPCHATLMDVPHNCSAGTDFVSTLADELEGVQKRKWNSERTVAFPIIILQRCVGVNSLSERRGVILRRLKAWKRGELHDLWDSPKAIRAADTILYGEEAVSASTHQVLAEEGGLNAPMVPSAQDDDDDETPGKDNVGQGVLS